VLGTDVPTYVLALIEIAIVHVFLHAFATHHCWPHHAYRRVVVHIIQSVSVGHVLSVDAASTLDHWQLLCI
jgi:hypothetical protein